VDEGKKKEGKKVRFEDWMGDSEEERDHDFSQTRFEGRDGHLRLQLEKTYKGDDRFKLTEDFDVSFADANRSKRHVPDIMMGGMSKREIESLFKSKGDDEEMVRRNTGGYESLDDSKNGEICWEHGIDVEKEKEHALNVLSRIVPASEVFLTSSKA
jgi:hypothetical protein